MSTLLLTNSCTTTLMSSQKQRSVNDVIETGKNYTFYKNDGTTQKINVAQITDGTVSGKTPDGKTAEIQTADITKIKKGNVLGTVAVVAGAIAIAVVLPAYVKNEPVGGR